MQLARQDEDLEELGTHVERVGETATVINEELRSQNRYVNLWSNFYFNLGGVLLHLHLHIRKRAHFGICIL